MKGKERKRTKRERASEREKGSERWYMKTEVRRLTDEKIKTTIFNIMVMSVVVFIF